MTKRILVTGGAGFLGSFLCERLIQDGNRVFCLDNLFTGSLSNIDHLISNERFTFIEYDIVDPISLHLKFDQIYNLACPASPIHYQKDPVKTILANTVGVINVLELARKNKAVVLQASTSEVYGDPNEHPQKETYLGNVNTIGPRACYDEGKRCAETLFFDYYRQFRLSIKVVRIFNTYGPRMNFDDGRVISNFILQALRGEPLTIYGNGNQTRSFCYVDDLINGLIAMMGSNNKIVGPINLGNPSELMIKEIAEKVIKLTNSKSAVLNKTALPDDPRQRRPDITIAKEKLGWQPNTELSTGLQKTIDDFRKRLLIKRASAKKIK